MRTVQQEVLKDLFDYDQATGMLTRKFSKRRFKKADNEITAKLKYRFVYVEGVSLLMHRAVWCWHHGNWPKAIDHIDGDSLNNRIENLRECTQQQNLQNRTKNKNSKRKFKGVIYRPAGVRGNRKDAYEVQVNGKYGGYFSTEVEAAQAYDKLATELYGEFARLNFPKEKV